MEGLGINWKILIGQIINFAILLYLLKRFAFKPFLNLIEKRKMHIEEGIKKSEEAEKSLQKIRVLEGEIRESGEKKTKEILKEAGIRAENKAKEILISAEREKEKIIEKVREATEKEIAEERIRRQKEIFDLALAVSEKFLKEKIDKEKDKKFLEELISEIK